MVARVGMKRDAEGCPGVRILTGIKLLETRTAMYSLKFTEVLIKMLLSVGLTRIAVGSQKPSKTLESRSEESHNRTKKI